MGEIFQEWIKFEVQPTLRPVLTLQRDSTYHKPFNSLTSVLAHPKQWTPPERKTGVVYDIICKNCAVVEEVAYSDLLLKGAVYLKIKNAYFPLT